MTIAMQVRCVHCLREQYALNVIGVSTGEDPCAWCGKHSREMTEAEYRAALEAARLAAGFL
jgi:hypothetical protein